MQKIGHDHYGSVYGALHLLREEGILDSSKSRPIKFFLKASGNPELRAAIPTGTKVSVMK